MAQNKSLWDEIKEQRSSANQNPAPSSSSQQTQGNTLWDEIKSRREKAAAGGQSGNAAVGQEPGVNPAKGTSRTHSWVYDKADSRVSPVGELGNSPYKEYLEREDYKQKSQATGSKKRLIGGDELYDYINNIGDERQLVEQLTQQGRGDKGYAKYAFMTEDEVGIYNYLYATEGKKAAKRFLNSIDPGLNEQWFSGASSSMADAATKSGANRAAFSALTVAAQPVRTATSAMAGVQDWFRVMNDREIDPYSPLRRTSQMTQSIRNAIAEQPGFVSSLSTAELMRAADEYALSHGTDANNPYIKAFTESSKEKSAADAFLYQTVMSAADSAVNMMIAQGLAQGYTGMKGIDLGTKAGTDALMKATNVIGSALMSSEVASLGVAEAKQKINPATGKRYSDAGALAIGMARGGIEYLSEKIGGDWAISMIKANPRNFLLNMAKIMIPEGVEEVMADTANGILNLGIDEIFGTQESSIPQLIEYYKNNGTPWQKENPEVAMVLSIIGDEMLAFMGGALATVGTAGVQTVNFNRGVNAVSQRLNTDQEGVLQLMDDYKTENPGEIYELTQRFNTEDVEDFRAKVGDGRTAAEVLEEQHLKDKAEAGTIAGKIRQGFRGVGHNLTDAEVKILADGFETGDADEGTYLSAIHSAYNLGKSGNFTLQEAIRASSYAGKINETQFRHAFELGASQALTDIDTVDVNTEEGQEKLAASLSSLGNYAVEAAAAYEAGQDVNTYAEAMYKAASLYVANGKDLDAVVADARSGKTSNIVGRLTDAQIQVAKAIGEKMRAANQEQVQKASQQRAAAREANTAGEKRVGNISIATESGSIEGMKYNAVDESKLNKSQKNVMRFADTVAKVLGLDITVVSGVGTFGGAYSGNGKIYLNINSGMNLRTYSKVIAAASLGHEIVHSLKDRAEAEYEVLKQRVIDSMSADKLEELVQEQLRTQPNLTYDGAVDEVVANACQTLLQNSEALKQLARESMTTAEKIQDVIHEFVEKIHAAFAEVDYHDNLPIFHAVQAVEKSLDEIQKDFDNALIAAKRNADAEVGGNKKAASEGGTVFQIQADTDLEETNIEDGRAAIEKLMSEAETSDDPESLVVENAMYRSDLGPIDFKWGTPGRGDKFKGGYGLAHIIAKRNAENGRGVEIANRIVEAIAKAKTTDTQFSDNLSNDHYRIRLYYEDITAVLNKDPGENHWLLTGWENNETAPSATGEVHDSAGATADTTTRTRRSGDAAVSDNRVAQNGEEVKNGEKKTYYQLIDVDPVQPSSDAWSRTATTEEAMQAYPNLWNVAAEESETNNPTQRASTVSTYRNIYNILKKEGFSGKVLDASSGMGFGTQLGRSKEFGFDVDDIEPYPGQNYKPKYTDYSKLNKKYDAIISSAVLNVLPQDQRDALVVKMGELLNPGGKMYITTRGTKGDVDNLAKTGKNIQLGPSEFIETVKGSYQKGFTQNELKAYLEDALGDQFTVELSNKSNGGKFNNNTSVVVTKNGAKAQSQPTAKVDSRVKRGTERQLQEIGSTATDGVVVSDDMAALMREDGFSKPVDPVDQLSTQYQVWTTDEWEKNYLTSGGDLTVAAQIRDFTNAMIADDAIMGYVPDGHYQKSRFGPLRKNIEYRWTFDMDASCPRTFQFVNYRNALQTIAGRPLTDSEAINLLYLMRRMNQQIPCTYCYVENKRIMKSKSYLDWFQSRADVMSAATDEEALKKMYSYDPKKGTVGAAAQKVFDEWRADVKAGKAYYPTAQEVWTGWNTAKNTVFNFLDKGLENGVIRFGEGVKNATTQKKMVDAVCKRFNITDKAARREIEGFVAKWRYDVLAGTKHVYDVVNDTSVDTINQDILRLNRLASNYASSVSQARLVDDYIPYTDQLKNVSKADKDYIMGMGGIRKHSSNDFRMDYVQDYFLFYADLAAGGWTGHTYTKSADYCKVFGRTGDRINLSIAMNTENGKIVENQQEGAAWKDARELREAYKDVGVMAMVTDNAQLSFALNSDWIDMCIPFHASGLPKAVWYNLRAWSDYTSVQLESYFNSTEMKERLTAAKVNVKGLNSEEIEALYNETFNVPVILNQNGQRVKPHFFPNDTTIYGPGGVAQVIPGHHNDAKRYFELCEQYGVHPRFYGTKVTDASGKVIDVTEHPNYLKLIKETSRTDTEQEPIKFNFNEKDEYLGVSPFEYAMQRMQEEAKIGGYKNTAADPLGIVDMFKELYLGKNRDIGWMPADTDESAAAERLRTAMEITQSAYNEMYDADVQTLDTEGYQKVLTEQAGPKAVLQVWDEGAVYNDRALVSEETLDKWMSSGWYGSSNPNYAQAYITSMSPSQFLRLTTIYDESRIRRESESFTMEGVRQASESQPIQLQIDTETGKVVGHEGRHRMAALERNGIYEVPVLLFDSGNKYSKQTMKEFRLYGQDFNGNSNIARATVYDVYPLNQAHRSEIVNAYSKQTYSEGFKERYNGAQTVRFQQWDETGDDTASEKQGRQSAYARLQSENQILRDTVKELKRTVGKQKTTLANIQKQLQLTKTPQTRLSDARKLAKAIIAETGSKAADGNVAAAIKQLGDYILNTQADQLNEEDLKNRARAIAREVLDSATETMTLEGETMQVNPYDAYMGEATEDLANRIVMDAMNGVLRPTAPTKADKQQARTQALKDRIQDLIKENKLQQREGASLYQTIYDLSLQLDKAQSRYETLRQNANRRVAEVRAEGAARAAEVKATERARAEGLLEEQKQHYLDIAKRARERRERTTSRSKVRRLIDDLNRRLANPTEKKYVPQELIRLTVDVLSAIDTDSGRGGEKLAAKLERIRTMYDSYQKDPKYAAVYDEVAAEMLRDMCVKVGNTGLYQMNQDQLETVYKTLKALTHIIDTAVKVKIGTEERNAWEIAQEMTGETRQIPKAQKGWLKQHWLPAGLRPDVAFKRFAGFKKNSAWESVVRMLNDGQLKQTDITMKLSLPFAELTNNASALRDFQGLNVFGHVDPSKLIDIGLKDENGEPIMVSHGIAAGIYMDLLNEDNRRHFIRGGKTVPNMKDYYAGKGGFGIGTARAVGISTELSELYHEQREAKAEGDISRSDELQEQIDELMETGESYADSVMKKIENQLTDYDREWIRLTQRLMDVEGKRYLNDTTMDVYGIEKATVDHYYPITSDPNYLASEFESVTRDMNLENVGFMKERVQSGNPTLAMDISSVVNNQIQRVAQYSGLMPAIRNFNKIWNKQGFGYSDSLKNALNDTFGEEGGQYVENLIADLTGSRGVGDDSLGLGRLFGRLRGNLAQTSLTLNPRVALAQAASYPTAAAEVGAKALAKAFFRGGKSGRMISRADAELIAKYSPLLYHRMQGYSSVELGDIKNSNRLSSRVWKKARWATGWIQAVDGATVGRLWYAAEYWVQDNMPSLEKGTDEYYQEVARKFNNVVEKTQPNYTTMQRPQILRDPNEMVKMLTMFMTQRLQNFNILYDAAGSYQKARADKANGRNGVTQTDVAEARSELLSAVSSQMAAAAVYVGFKLLADGILRNMKAYRDDEDGELTAESVSLQLLDNYIDTFAGMFIGGSEIYSVLKALTGQSKWYGLSLNGVDSVNDLVDDIVKLSTLKKDLDLSNEEDKAKFNSQLSKTALSLCQALGIPANNAVKIKDAIVNTIKDTANGNFWSFDAGYNVTKAQQKLRDIEALGFTKEEAKRFLEDANTNGKTGINQEELYNYIQSHNLTDEQIQGLWDLQGWKMGYDEYSSQQEKKDEKIEAMGFTKDEFNQIRGEAETNGYKDFDAAAPIYGSDKKTAAYAVWESKLKPRGMSLDEFTQFLRNADASGDGNGSIKQDEMGYALYAKMQKGELTFEEADAVWRSQWNNKGSKYFEKWLRENGLKK